MKIFFKWIIIILIFQDWLMGFIPIITNLDEILCILTIIYALLILFQRKVKIVLTKYEIYALNLFIIFIILGLIANCKFNIINFKIAILSMLMTTKGYILYFGWRIIFQAYNIKFEILKDIAKILKLSIYIFTIIAVLDIPLNFLKVRGYRFGIKNVSIGFSHPTELAFFVVISMCIVLLYNNVFSINKSSFRFICCCVFLIILTGRSKAIAYIFIFVVMLYLNKFIKKIKLKYLIALSPIAIYIAMPRIISEFIHGARGELYRGAMNIANDFFPLGSGFGTFGSNISKVYYSPLYYYYGLYKVWGLSPEMSSYISDTYWAMILGEGGWIGLIIVGIILFLIFTPFFKVKANNKLKILSISLILYSITTSIAEPIYSSNKCAALFIVLALMFTLLKKNSIEIQERKYGEE